jgi:hypothetical protein
MPPTDLLPPDFRLDTPSALLDALARLSPSEEPSGALWSRLPAGREPRAAAVLASRLVDAAKGLAPPAWPSSIDEQSERLFAVERVACATRTLGRLDERYPWAPTAARLLSGLLDEHRMALRAAKDRWRHAQLAAERRAAVGDALPWSEIHAVDQQGLVAATAADRDAMVSEWLLGTLCAEDDATLRRLVTEDVSWRTIYVSRVRSRLAEVRLLGVEEPRVLLHVPLPHVRASAAARLLVDGKGLTAEWPDHPAELRSADAAVVVWPSDAVLGALSTRLEQVESRNVGLLLSALQNARRALAVEPTLALTLALQATDTLCDKKLLAALSAGAEAFKHGREENLREFQQIAQYAVEVRATLEELASRSLAPRLLEALDACDEEVFPLRDAVLLVPDDVLEESLGDRWVEFDGWWGRKVASSAPRIERALSIRGKIRQAMVVGQSVDVGSASAVRRPVKVVAIDTALAVGRIFSTLGKGTSSSPFVPPSRRAVATGRVAQAAGDDLAQLLRALASCPDVSLSERFQAVNTALRNTACPWFSVEVSRAFEELERAWASSPERSAMATTLRFFAVPRPGVAPVLAALEQLGLAGLWELRITHQETGMADPWAAAPFLGNVARNAIRDAYFAVASLLPGRVAPHALEEHAVALVGGELDVDALDGPSLALSAALAFASLWTSTPLPADLAATGRLLERPGAGVLILPVGWVLAKVQALRSRRVSARILVAKGDVGSDHDTMVERVGVDGLSEALVIAGIPLQRALFEMWGGSVVDRRRQLEAFCEDVSSQRLTPYQGLGRDPWQVLADRIRSLVSSLEREDDVRSRQTAATGRACAALAYTHAMDEAGVRLMLAGADLKSAPPSVLCFSHIVESGGCIDRKDWDGCHRLQDVLAADLEALPRVDREQLAGMVFGTRGRAWMHERRLDLALPLLQAAVLHHAGTSPREVGRSRLYLAMAHRMAGDVENAIGELEKAATDVVRCRREDAVYATQTEMFLQYELTRTLLAAGQPEPAIQAGERALSRARATGAWWPLLGVLRTLIWAYRAAGRSESANDLMEELEVWVSRGTPLARELLTEAAGEPGVDGEVY